MAALGVFMRKMSTSASRNAIKNVTVIGGGLMGSGIAQVNLLLILCHNVFCVPIKVGMK